MYCILTDGDRFIYRDYQGKYVPTRSESMADHFSKKQAQNVLKSCLPKALKSIFRIKIIDPDPVADDLVGMKPVTKEDISLSTIKVSESDSCNVWIHKIKDCICTKDEMRKRKTELEEQQSTIDREIAVLLHYAEFGRPDASGGWRFFKAVKNRTIQRRQIKNEIEVIKIGLSMDFNTTKEESFQHMIDALDNRNYNPKEIEGLFDL